MKRLQWTIQNILNELLDLISQRQEEWNYNWAGETQVSDILKMDIFLIKILSQDLCLNVQIFHKRYNCPKLLILVILFILVQ